MRTWGPLVALLFVGVILVGMPSPSCAAPLAVTGTELVTHGKLYNRRIVAFTGQVIGSPIRDGRKAWVNVSDGFYAIGALVEAKELSKINSYGSYWDVGAEVRVVGTFYTDDASQGGETDIRATTLQVIRPGHPVPHPVNRYLVFLTPLTGVVALLLFDLDRRKRRSAHLS